MLNHLFRSTIVLAMLIFPLLGNAQTNELKKHLNEKEIKKLTSSEKLIMKGNSVINEVKELEEEVETLKNAEGRIKTRKINKRNQKIAETKMKASILFEDGYGKHINILDKRIKALAKEGNSEAAQTRNDVHALEKKAKKQYNKAERLTTPADMIEMLELAQENQSKAIAVQEKFLLSVLESSSTKEDVVEVIESDEEIVAVVDSTTIIEPQPEPSVEEIETTNVPVTTIEPEVTSTAAIATGAAVATVAAIPEETEETPEEELAIAVNEETTMEEPEPVKDVFLSIQFLADKQKASETQLKQAYSGNLEIIEKTGNGWYRYSLGKFTDVAKAQKTMQDEKIKGFIVAYNKDERISVKEALELISNK